MLRRFCNTAVLAGVAIVLIASCTENTGAIKTGDMGQPGKPAAPVSISYAVLEKVVVGERVEITITVTALSRARSLTVKLTAGEGLNLTGGEFEAEYAELDAGESVSETVTVVPSIEGVLYLNVFVTGGFGPSTMGRIGAVPINVGESEAGRKGLKSPGTPAIDDKGEKIIIMPAEER